MATRQVGAKPPKGAKIYRSSYSQDSLTVAYKRVTETGMPVREAAKKYNVPRSTLQDKVKGK